MRTGRVVWGKTPQGFAAGQVAEIKTDGLMVKFTPDGEPIHLGTGEVHKVYDNKVSAAVTAFVGLPLGEESVPSPLAHHSSGDEEFGLEEELEGEEEETEEDEQAE
jgi:hypothetical protein